MTYQYEKSPKCTWNRQDALENSCKFTFKKIINIRNGGNIMKKCIKCGLVKDESEFYKGLNRCKSCHKEYCKEYMKSDKFKEYLKSDKRKEYMKEYLKNRSKTDINFKMIKWCRSQIFRLVKTKKLHSFEYIGCSVDFLLKYLQQTAKVNGYSDFDINSYIGKEYHIDHVVPCSSFNFDNPKTKEANLKLCCNFRNLQVLKANDNLMKHDGDSVKSNWHLYLESIGIVDKIINTRDKVNLTNGGLNENL